MRNIEEEIYKRTDITQIRGFLLDGVENLEETKSTEQKLKESSKAIYKRLENIYPDADELDKATDDLMDALATYEKVYTEIGMKAGARILYNLLLSE